MSDNSVVKLDRPATEAVMYWLGDDSNIVDASIDADKKVEGYIAYDDFPSGKHKVREEDALKRFAKDFEPVFTPAIACMARTYNLDAAEVLVDLYAAAIMKKNCFQSEPLQTSQGIVQAGLGHMIEKPTALLGLNADIIVATRKPSLFNKQGLLVEIDRLPAGQLGLLLPGTIWTILPPTDENTIHGWRGVIGTKMANTRRLNIPKQDIAPAPSLGQRFVQSFKTRLAL